MSDRSRALSCRSASIASFPAHHHMTGGRARAAPRLAPLAAAAGVTAAMLLLGCEVPVTEPEGETDGSTVASLTVQPTEAESPVGDTLHFEAAVLNESGQPVTSGYTLSWSSSDPAVATVDDAGVATVRDSGSATITATVTDSGTTLSDDALLRGRGGDSGNGSGSVSISSLRPSAYELDTVKVGEAYYIDRSFTVEAVPVSYEGWTLIRTANKDKTDSTDSFLSFELSDSATVALAYDSRATSLPGWLKGWSATGDSLITTDDGASPLPIHRRVFGPGTVELGGNLSDGAEGASSMYVPFVSAGAPDDGGGGDDGGDTDSDSVATVTVSPDSASLSSVGDTARFSATATNADGTTLSVSFRWQSSDTSVATVDGGGTATAQAEGTARITATADGVVDSATLTVEATTPSGALEVTTSTSGEDLDPDGYVVAVDGGSNRTVGINSTVTFGDLAASEHSIELSGVASNCSVTGTNPRNVTVVAEDTVSITFDVGCEARTGSGNQQIVVDPDNPSWLIYENGDPFVMVGPGDPEGFLYRGSRNSDGSRDGDQLELIQKLGGTAANSIYLMAVRSHGGDGNSTHNPFIDSDPANGLNQDILNQWETWFTEMEERGITIFFIFYDDSSNPWTDGGSTTLSEKEKDFVRVMVESFTHHTNLIWAVAEEYSESFSSARISNFASYLRSIDPNNHPIAVHQHAGTTFDFSDDPNIDIHAMQLHSSDVDDLHAAVNTAWSNASGRYHLGMYEWGKGGSNTPHGTLSDTEVRQGNWASIMAGATVMVYGMNIDGTSLSQLQQTGVTVSFFEDTDVHHMTPDDSRAFGSTEWVLANDPDSYVLYTRQGGSDPGLTNLQAGTYDLLWLDTVTGDRVLQTGVTIEAGDQTWTPPSSIGNELALYIKMTQG